MQSDEKYAVAVAAARSKRAALLAAAKGVVRAVGFVVFFLACAGLTVWLRDQDYSWLRRADKQVGQTNWRNEGSGGISGQEFCYDRREHRRMLGRPAPLSSVASHEGMVNRALGDVVPLDMVKVASGYYCDWPRNSPAIYAHGHGSATMLTVVGPGYDATFSVRDLDQAVAAYRLLLTRKAEEDRITSMR